MHMTRESRNLDGHAYLIAGGTEKRDSLLKFLKECGIEVEGNPDVYIREYLSFKIDDARELRERAMARAVLGARRVFIVTTPAMTTDAQNALLKVLEEPYGDALFFFLVPSPSTLLATFRSRAQTLELDPLNDVLPRTEAARFLQSTLERRIDMLKPLYQRNDGEERDIRGAILLLSALERELRGKSEAGEGIRAIYRARKYVTDKGALLKPLLEQVALLVPHV